MTLEDFGKLIKGKEFKFYRSTSNNSAVYKCLDYRIVINFGEPYIQLQLLNFNTTMSVCNIERISYNTFIEKGNEIDYIYKIIHNNQLIELKI